MCFNFLLSYDLTFFQEHIAQVDMENSALSRITHNMSVIDSEAELKGKSEADLCLDVQTLVDKILYLRGQLALANQRAEKPVDIHGTVSLSN
jgi:hypothetical protein